MSKFFWGRLLAASLLSFSMAGCASATLDNAPKPVTGTNELPVMRWDHRPEAINWTTATLAALKAHGTPLVDTVPKDIAEYCPAYPNASPKDRAAFWSGLLSALAKHESTWRPEASGGGGQWIGLVQIAPTTARGYGCQAKSVAALKNGSANLSCAVRIMSRTVLRDGVVSAGRGGVAADWAPFLNSSKQSDMAAWTSQQSYCR